MSLCKIDFLFANSCVIICLQVFMFTCCSAFTYVSDIVSIAIVLKYEMFIYYYLFIMLLCILLAVDYECQKMSTF